MKNFFIPHYYSQSIYDIKYERLIELGIKNILIDIDNTLAPWGSIKPDLRAKEHILRLTDMGFNICILSNSSKKRVKTFSDELGVTFFSLGIKPMVVTFRGAIKFIKGNIKDTCIIGDQIFTDIFGGRRIGILTILVEPISTKELPTTRYIRRLEKYIKTKYEKEILKLE